MKIAIKGLRAKPTAGGVRYYWEPSPAERRAKWKPIALGQDLDAAMRAARARNDEVEIWREGGAKPRQVKTFIKRATVAALIDRYRRDEFPGLAKNTRATYGTALRRIEAIFGDVPAAGVARKHVRQFRDAMMKPKAHGGVGHTSAHTTLRVLRTLFQWAIDKADMDLDNPAVHFDLETPAPRHQIWDELDSAAFDAAAEAIGLPGLGFAIAIAEYIGQRETDLLRLNASQWREVKGLDRDTREALVSDHGPDAGKVMGIFIRQGKTNRWIGVPVAGDMRDRIEAQIAANDNRAREPGAIAVTNLLINDASGLPWQQRHFIRKFAEAKALAVKGFTYQGRIYAPRPELAELQFRDLRRTAVVRLGELGLEDQLIAAITGHKLETVKKILEVYMPRTTKMAARAVVARIGQARPADAGGSKEQTA